MKRESLTNKVGNMPKKINDFLWEIDKSENPGMKVPIHIYASEKIVNTMGKDRTIRQAMNAASLPSIVKHMLVMPDGHEGYGFPVGGVAAFDAENGIISPGAVGYDINCGVRLIKTNLTVEELRPKLSRLMDQLMKNVPSGVGSRINLGFTRTDLERVANEGVGYIVDKGFGFKEDVDHIEEYGRIKGADFNEVSDFAKKRGTHELGTLGAGNHFLEVQRISETFDKKIAKGYGLEKDNVTILIHSGSRGFGHQICSDYLRTFSEYQQKNNIVLPDPELSYADVNSREAESYLKSMRCAVNFAFVNRQIMTNSIRKAFETIFEKSADSMGMELLYDVAHNIAKLEEHNVDGRRMKLYVHRKGATRAFGPGRDDIPKKFKELGQPVLIPGSMGSASYVLAGRSEAMTETFGSSCHGSGRVMSRHQAIRDIPASRTLDDLKDKGIELRVRNKKLISEEAEWAYKDVNEVVQSIAGAKISNIVAKLVPLGVAKG